MDIFPFEYFSPFLSHLQDFLPGLTIVTISNTASAVSETGLSFTSIWVHPWFLGWDTFCSTFQFSVLVFYLCTFLRSVSCAPCCQCTWIVHSWLSLLFFQTLTFIFTYHSSYIYIQILVQINWSKFTSKTCISKNFVYITFQDYVNVSLLSFPQSTRGVTCIATTVPSL